jgi:flagellar basal-body rod protein FlgB
MFDTNSFGRTLDILQRSMDVSLLRQDVIADNIANGDTPNFKRSTVNFESQLAAALESESPERMQLAMTRPGHVSNNRTVDYTTVRANRQLDYLTTADNNGNNVDIEVESMNYLNAQLMYTLMTNSVSEQFKRLQIVLAE